MVKGLKKFTYKTILKRLGIYSLKRRRLRGDLIETFKILTEENVSIPANSSNCRKIQVDYKVTLWSYTSKDVAQLLDSASSVRVSSIPGTDYLKMSSKQHQLTCSKTVWTNIGKIWGTTADWLCSSSSPSTSIERRDFQWPWTTPNLVFKVTPFFYTEYLTHGYRYGHSYYRMRRGNRTQAFEWH